MLRESGAFDCPMDRVPNQLISTPEIEFVLDVLPIRLNCLDTEVYLFGDLLGAETSSKHVENLELSI